MNTILEEAKQLQNELVENRHVLHQIPEIGFTLPKTFNFIKDKLIEYGYEPQEVYKCGIIATIGDPTKGKTILLRCDMDALPMKEESGLEFCATGSNAHTCGHDLHMAMLLGAAKLLKKHENELNGCVKLMFQPDEEGGSGDVLTGAERMIEHGILENPKVDVAFGMHIWSGLYDSGIISYRKGSFMCSCDLFNINIQGTAAHGSRPQDGVSPINIGCHIYLAIQELIAREVSPFEQAIVTLGAFNSGSSNNQIPNTAILKGTLRCSNEQDRILLRKRIDEIVPEIAKNYSGIADVTFFASSPCVYSDPELTEEMMNYNMQMLGEEYFLEESYAHSGGEDMGFISQAVPTCFIFLACGSPKQGYTYAHHHPSVLFDETQMYKGCALYVNSAIQWLKNHVDS